MIELTDDQKRRIAGALVTWNPDETGKLTFIEIIEEIIAEHPSRPTYSQTLPQATKIVEGFLAMRCLMSMF